MATRQAVLLIHGIGEQKPMDTLRGFVDTVWSRDTKIHNRFAGSSVWSKPDTVSASYELRRLTTPKNTAGIRTDFFEFYWAHLMKGTSYGHVLSWARALLVRNPASVPRHLRMAWWLIVLLLVVAAGFAIYALLAFRGADAKLPAWLSATISLVLLPIGGFVVRAIVGDAARYLRPEPTNIQRRHEIRHAGVELLKTLHGRGYDRIIVVGHSLGSVIGYDILTYAWVDYNDKAYNTGDMRALEALERLAADRRAAATSEELQAAQRRYFEEMRQHDNAWRVTDFVTLGSPLAHAAILLAKDAADLVTKQVARELPTCPPTIETSKKKGLEVHRFSFGDDDDHRVPHHAAVFGPTRWTNLYFPCHAIVKGDLIGGKLRAVFGSGIRDRDVRTSQRGGFFSHTLYWTYPRDAEEAPSHITALREALDLADGRA